MRGLHVYTFVCLALVAVAVKGADIVSPPWEDPKLTTDFRDAADLYVRHTRERKTIFDNRRDMILSDIRQGWASCVVRIRHMTEATPSDSAMRSLASTDVSRLFRFSLDFEHVMKDPNATITMDNGILMHILDEQRRGCELIIDRLKRF